jgi:Tfp pilus assembly protein PilW
MLSIKSPRRAGGFSLVELMVALVVGLIVVGAVLALVVAITKSNRQTLQSTRLNQELRATLAMVASDLRRARSVSDPLTTAKATGGNPYSDIDTSTADCLHYGYEDAPGGDWHVVRRVTSDTPVRLVLFSGASVTCTTSTGGVPLGSKQVEITAFSVTPSTTTTALKKGTRRFDITITGQLVDQDAELNSISRTMTQTVYIRSIGSGS